MRRESCYEVVIDLVTQATKRNCIRYKLNEKMVQQLPGICQSIESVIHENECEYFDVDVYEDTMQLVISIVSEDMVISRKETPRFCDFVRIADFVSFSRPQIDSLRTEFRFDHVWEMRGDG